jgi:tetratricopeptide (TPR) repeat protein
MPKSLIKNLLIIVISIITVIIIFNYSIYLGILAVVACISVIAYVSRASLYAIQGNAKYSRGDLSGALVLYEKAYRIGKCKTNFLISYAYLLLRSGNLEKSEQLLGSVFKRELKADEKMIANSNMALILWKKGDIDGATSLLESVFENYKNTNMYGSLGYMLILKGDLDRALNFNLEAYEYNNSNNVILDNLAQTYYLIGEYDKSEELYKKILESNPTVPGIYYNYGLLLSDMGQAENALKYLKKALEFKINFLSGVTEEEIKSKIEEVEKGLAS